MIQSTPKTVNGQIERLKQQLTRSELTRLDCVIFAHSDNRMLRQLKEAFVEMEIVVLAVPQNEWCMNDEETNELLDWLVNDLAVGRVLLVGHSQGGTPADAVQICGEGKVDPSTNGYANNRISSLMERVKYAQAGVRQAEEHFLGQLNCLNHLPALQGHQLRNQQFVQGLFYRAESGVFCHYDSNTKQFRALISDN